MWGYLYTQHIAPVWIGEMGSDLRDATGQTWAQTMVDYMNGKYASQGGPEFHGCEQPVPGSWWLWGYFPVNCPTARSKATGPLPSPTSKHHRSDALQNHYRMRGMPRETIAGECLSRAALFFPQLPLCRLSHPKPLRPSSQRLKVVVTGGHPGDPECGCAGTIARYTELGHDVVLLYMNRGEGYCSGAALSQCGAIRTAEAEKACQILKARPAFVGQYDGRPIVDNAHYDEFRRIFDAEQPDVVFSQWPIDQHRDHRALSDLVIDAWLKGGKKSAFYYYEVAEDTMMFSPDEFVDVSSVEDRRRAACYAHASQNPDKWFPLQMQITRFRGTESGCPDAEGFLRHFMSKRAFLP